MDSITDIRPDGGTLVYSEANADEQAVITRHHLCSYNLRYFIAGELQWARHMTTASDAAVFLRRFGFPSLDRGIKRIDPEYQTDAEIRELLAFERRHPDLVADLEFEAELEITDDLNRPYGT